MQGTSRLISELELRLVKCESVKSYQVKSGLFLFSTKGKEINVNNKFFAFRETGMWTADTIKDNNNNNNNNLFT